MVELLIDPNCNFDEIFEELFNNYEMKIIDLLNFKINFPISNNIITSSNIPYEYETILPINNDYNFAISNLFNNDKSFIPNNKKIMINNMYIYYSKNKHNKNALFIYPTGYEELNEKGIYPFITAPLQINVLKDCKNHNALYNGKYYTQITILNDINGIKFIERNKLIYNAYFSNIYIEALKQIIYITQNIYKKINIKFNKNNINEKFIYKIVIAKKLKKTIL